MKKRNLIGLGVKMSFLFMVVFMLISIISSINIFQVPILPLLSSCLFLCVSGELSGPVSELPLSLQDIKTAMGAGDQVRIVIEILMRMTMKNVMRIRVMMMSVNENEM